jgi:GGDEF domain-containing protein
MQLSALQIFYFGLVLLTVAIFALIRDTFKRRRLFNQASADITARLDQPLPGKHPVVDHPAKVQPIDGAFSKRRADSRTWPAANSTSIIHAAPRHGEPADAAPSITAPAPAPVAAPAPVPPPAPASEAAPEATQSPCMALILPPVTVDALLWERLLALPTQAEIRAATTRRVEPPPVPSLETRFEVVSNSLRLEAAEAPARLETPAGMIEEQALKEMITRARQFTGLVVSIGLNESEDGVWRGEGLYQSIANFVAGVLGKNDVGCRTAIDEFLVIVPDKQGADAQNHLNQVADRLWDFQLRGVGACAILFSWGGATVDGQSLASAITSATQRMRQAKQRRNPRPMRALGAYQRAN